MDVWSVRGRWIEHKAAAKLSDRQVFCFDESSLDWNINLNYYYSILLMQTHQNTSKSIKEIFKFDLHSL